MKYDLRETTAVVAEQGEYFGGANGNYQHLWNLFGAAKAQNQRAEKHATRLLGLVKPRKNKIVFGVVTYR